MQRPRPLPIYSRRPSFRGGIATEGIFKKQGQLIFLFVITFYKLYSLDGSMDRTMLSVFGIRSSTIIQLYSLFLLS